MGIRLEATLVILAIFISLTLEKDHNDNRAVVKGALLGSAHLKTLSLNQEIIKVRERIPHIGPLTKVIPLKLFLDMEPSSSEVATRAMRGQASDFLETT